MKNYNAVTLLWIVIQLNVITSNYSQATCDENFNLSQHTCSNGYFTAPFNQDPVPCNLQPWKASHGTPDAILGNSGGNLVVVAGRGDCGMSSQNGSEDALSEGVFHDGYFFKKDVQYSITGTIVPVLGTMDEVYIKLANNYFSQSTIGTGVPCNGTFNDIDTYRGDFDQMFDILTLENLNGNYIINLCFIPDQDYNQLWVSCYMDGPGEPSGTTVISYVNILDFVQLQIEAICDPFEIYTTTYEDQFGFSGLYIPLPRVKQTRDYIELLSQDGIIETRSDIESGNESTMKAGDYISIKPANGNKIHFQSGTTFHAKIEGCDECAGENICNYFVDDDWQELEFFDALNTCSTGPERNWFVGYNYAIPYNAHSVSYGIFDRFGNPMKQESFSLEEDGCDALTIAKNFEIIWDGSFNGQQTEQGVYTYVIELENCFDTKVFGGDITKFGTCE